MRTSLLPADLAQEWQILRRETDAELRGEATLQWASRVSREGRDPAAAEAYAELLADPDASESQRRRARARMEILAGGGSWLDRFEHQAPHLTRELFSPASILAMAVGGGVFRMTRWTMLGRLSALPAGVLTRGRAATLAASTLGFLAEAPAFTLSSQALRGQLGSSPLDEELLRSYLSLGSLRVGGGLAQGLQGALGWGANRLLRSAFAQSGMLGGIWMGGLAEERLDLRPERRSADRLFDSLITWAHFNVGGRIAQEVMGSQFRAWESRLDHRSAVLAQDLEAPRSRLQTLGSPWLAPMWMALGAGGLGGFGLRRPAPRNQLSLPFSASSRPLVAAVFRSPDLARAESLRQAPATEFATALARLQGEGLLTLEADQVSYIQHLRLASGIERLGEILRAQGPESAAAGQALRELAAEHRPAVLRELSRSLRESPSVLGGLQAIQLMTELRAVELLPELQALPSRPATALGVAAENARVRWGDSSLLPELQRRAFDRQQPSIDRVAALEAWGRLGETEAAVAELRTFFRHFHPPALQTRAALALTRLGAQAAILSFESRLERSNPRERADYAQALFERGSHSQALTIWESLARGDSEARHLALELAAAHPQAEMKPALQRLLSDAYPAIRLEATRLLTALAAESGDTAILESFLTQIEPSSVRQSEAIQISAASALFRRGPHDAARERLQSYLGSSFGESRLEAAIALLNHGEAVAAGPTLEALSEGSGAALRHRAAAALLRHRSGSRSGPSGASPGFGPGLGLLGVGALSWLLHPSIAEASTGLTQAGDSWWLPAILFGGGLAMAVSRRGDVAAPSPAASPREEVVSWFENPYDGNETYLVPELGEGTYALGRSTAAVPNIFSSDYRSISRRHVEVRALNGQLEIRNLEGKGLRINDQNFDSNRWHLLRDGDVVEFIGEGNADIPAYLVDAHKTADVPGTVITARGQHLVPGILRLGRHPADSSDSPPIFRFRQTRRPLTPLPPAPETRVESPAVTAAPSQGLLQRLAGLFARRPSEPPAVAAEIVETAPPAPALQVRPASQVHAEIVRLASVLSAPIAMLEQGTSMSDFQTPRSRNSILDGLLRIHRQFCGNEMQTISVAIRHSESGEYHEHPYEVPHWDGVLARRLSDIEQEIAAFRNEPGGEALQARARSELGKARDHANRLYDLVRLLRRRFDRLEPHEAARFDAIEAAYHGFRNERPLGTQRVRSLSRGLHVDLEPSQRERWIQEFLSSAESSRAAVNARILNGEIREVHGLPVAGSLSAALSGGTLYEGRRSVLVYYDPRGGQILGFEDGRPSTREAMARFEQAGIEVAEGRIRIDPEGDGRIVEVQFHDDSPRDAVAAGLQGLVQLRVLPPQSLVAWNGHAGDPDLRAYQLQLTPAVESPRETWFRVAGLVRPFEAGQSLLTLEPLHPSPERQGLQLILPEIDVLGIEVEDVLTVREHSSLESQP